MVKYEKLGYNNLDEYYEDFKATLIPTNHTFDYFVNWDKIFKKIEKNVVEINILNSLSKIPDENVEPKFREILKKYPEVVQILPSILAIRYDKKRPYEVDIFDETFKIYSFDKNNFNIDDIVYFCKETGLLNLFTEIDDLYAYLMGTEVGLDTNARKNRSGTSFENIMEQLLRKKIENKPGYTLHPQTHIKGINRSKVADFIISKNGVQKIAFECNIYNGGGSKPIEVANAYMPLQEEISENNMVFIWVTDGPGWKGMERTLKEVSPKIEYIVNRHILDKNFDKILELK